MQRRSASRSAAYVVAPCPIAAPSAVIDTSSTDASPYPRSRTGGPARSGSGTGRDGRTVSSSVVQEPRRAVRLVADQPVRDLERVRRSLERCFDRLDLGVLLHLPGKAG